MPFPLWAPLLLIALLFIIRLGLPLWREPPNSRSSSVTFAAWIAGYKWRMINRTVAYSSIVVCFEEEHNSALPFDLNIGKEHLDKGQINSLLRGDIVEFDFLQEPMEGAAGIDIARYLRIKKVSRPN